MVLRVLIVLFCVIFSISNLMDSPAAAGGAPEVAPPQRISALPQSAPPRVVGLVLSGFAAASSLCAQRFAEP